MGMKSDFNHDMATKLLNASLFFCLFSHHMQITLSGPPATHHHLYNSELDYSILVDLFSVYMNNLLFALLQNLQGNNRTLYKDEPFLAKKVKFMFSFRLWYHAHTYTHTALQNGPKEQHTHSQNTKYERTHTHQTFTCTVKPNICRKVSSRQIENYFLSFDYLTVSSWHDFAIIQFTLHVHSSGSTQLSYQRGRGSTRVNRKFSQ